MIRAAEFHIALQGHRVITLNERVQEFVDGNGLVAFVPLGEIVSLQHARNSVTGGYLDEPRSLHIPEPARIEIDRGFLGIEDLEYLLLVSSGIRFDLVASEGGSRGIAPRWIPNHSGEITDEERDLVTESLELAHLVDEHGVAEVQI